MTSPSSRPHRCRSRAARRGSRPRADWPILVLLAIASLAGQSIAFGQEKADKNKAAAVFDDEPKKAGDAQPPATPKTQAVSDRDTIGFTQQNVASQMTELEERMFRLSEALRSLEPENASRLSLALKFSREELILHQMQETHKLLKEAQLSKAETEVRQLLAKLEHLRSLLLAEDLDFQMKLARLRQMKETLGQLERIIKEEKRELAWSRSAVDQQADLEKLKNKKTDLEAIVRDQKKVVNDTKAAAAAAKAASNDSREATRAQETAIQKKAGNLAAHPSFATLKPPYLKQADPHLGDAISLLEAANLDGASAAEGKALELFQMELDRLTARIASIEKETAPPEFQRFEKDQLKNRNASDSLSDASARLGDAGVSLQKDLIRASASMQSAEGDLARTAAKPASDDQLEALKHLSKSRDDLARAVESLLVELRTELQTRIIGELTEMQEMQKDIRESTEAQAPRVAQKSRTALLLLAGLSQREGELAGRSEHLAALTEETEFGIALPTALHVLGKEMTRIQEWLKDGDASPHTVTLEKRVEQDLLSLLEALRRLPPTTPPAPGTPLPTDPRARERELNRLIAELKMIRLLQTRLDDDTIEVDGSRPTRPGLTPELRRQIEALTASQEVIRNSLAKIASRAEVGNDTGIPGDPEPTGIPGDPGPGVIDR